MSRWRSVGRDVGTVLLPIFAACWIAVREIKGGTLFPWVPYTPDLWVYREAGKYFLVGRDFYALEGTFPFIYPPISAVLAIPLSLLPWTIAQLAWTALNAVLVVAMLRRLGVEKRWQLSFGATAAIVFLMPFSNTIGMGQLGIVLVSMVVLDLVDPPHGRPRRIPGGILIGLAAGLKLTPAVFILHLFLIGRRRDGFVALGTLAATIGVGIAVAPSRSLPYWQRLAGGNSGANPDAYGWIANISLLSSLQRFTSVTATATLIGLGLSGLLVALGLAVAAFAHFRGHGLLGLSLLGVVSSLANPIAWAHHFPWVLPLAMSVFPHPSELRTTPVPASAPPMRSLGPPARRSGGRFVPRRLDPPRILRTIVLITALWLTLQPQGVMPGAPWAQHEIHGYSVAEKIFAAGPVIVVLITLGATLIALSRRGAGSPAKSAPRGGLADGTTESIVEETEERAAWNR